MGIYRCRSCLAAFTQSINLRTASLPITDSHNQPQVEPKHRDRVACLGYSPASRLLRRATVVAGPLGLRPAPRAYRPLRPSLELQQLTAATDVCFAALSQRITLTLPSPHAGQPHSCDAPVLSTDVAIGHIEQALVAQ